MWLDISLVKVVDGIETKVDATPVPLTFTLTVPEDLRAEVRTYYVLRAHDGQTDIVSTGTDADMTVSTDRFSAYVLASKDAQAKQPAAAAKGTMSKTGDNLVQLAVLFAALCIMAFGALSLLIAHRE